MTPKIYYNDVKFRLRSTRSIKDLILKVIRSEGKRTGDLSFIFTGRDKMLALNVEFLGHDYHTDVITFSYGRNEVVEGEIYLGIDTIRDNARLYNTVVLDEVLRVMIHGVLHLAGYYDGNDVERREMRRKEEFYLGWFKKGENGVQI